MPMCDGAILSRRYDIHRGVGGSWRSFVIIDHEAGVRKSMMPMMPMMSPPGILNINILMLEQPSGIS